MPNQNTPTSPRQRGFFNDQVNGLLEIYYNGTRWAASSASATTFDRAVTVSTGLTATTGNIVATAGDVRITAGNARLGTVSTFASTEPTSAVVMKVGTAPAGAITTSGGIFTDGTTVKKIIADGTVSDVQT